MEGCAISSRTLAWFKSELELDPRTTIRIHDLRRTVVVDRLDTQDLVIQDFLVAIKLSFCFPTLNFGAYIGETLRSIISQADERVEIVIIDGGSTDNTAEIVADAKRHFPRIQFIQRDRSHSLDSRILEMVSFAEGEHCWLFSADDLLAPKAIERAMKAIDSGGWDIFLMGITLCDLEMCPQYNHPILDCGQPGTFDWSIPEQRAAYFQRARTSTAFFSFISDQVVRRDRWLATPTPERFMGSCWIHSAKVFSMSQTNLRVRFDPDIYVLRRGDNDSFVADGIIRRIELSMRGFRDLACYFYGEGSFEATEVSRVIRNEYPLIDMLELKRQIIPGCSRKTEQDFYDLVRRHYEPGAPNAYLCRLLLRLTPIWVLSILRPPYRFARRLFQPWRRK
jgi:abequosyltransferase